MRRFLDGYSATKLRLHMWEQRQIERLHDEDDLALEAFNHALEEIPHWISIFMGPFTGGGHG